MLEKLLATLVKVKIKMGPAGLLQPFGFHLFTKKNIPSFKPIVWRQGILKKEVSLYC
jgi:hypothetical protein